MKYGWMIYPKSATHNRYGNNAFEWMTETAARHRIHLKIVFAEELMISCGVHPLIYRNGEPVRRPDFVLMRCYDRITGAWLETMGVRVINRTQAMFCARNKLITAELLDRAGLPAPGTLYMTRCDYVFARSYFHDRPFVLKQVEGSQGKNVFLIENEPDFRHGCKRTGGYFLCQTFIGASAGRDLRVYVLGGRAIGCVMRKSHGDFRANYALGGSAEAYALTPEIERLSVQAAEAVGLEFCGIDLLFGTKGPLVCEVNGNAGFRTLWNTSHVDVAEKLFEYVDRSVYDGRA